MKKLKRIAMLLWILLLFLPAAAFCAEDTGTPATGSLVTFGAYEQDNDAENGSEPIAWVVLDYDADKDACLLISRYALDVIPFHSEEIYPTWARSDVRVWLNGEFLNNAFSAEEQRAIRHTSVHTPDNEGISGGPDTADQIFLLSEEEVRDFFPKTDVRVAFPTVYAAARGAYQRSTIKLGDNGSCSWWLRSPTSYPDYACDITVSGDISQTGVNYSIECIRPALWAEVSALKPLNEEIPEETAFIPATAAEQQDFTAVGTFVTYGTYEQDNVTGNGAEPIEWLVLDYNAEAKACLLISRYGLDVLPYNSGWDHPTWETCELRAWLNGDFLNTAFTEEERQFLLPAVIHTPNYLQYEGGRDTEDRIWVLSRKEAVFLFADDAARKAAPTPYAVARGAYRYNGTSSEYRPNTDGSGWWWLRSPGDYTTIASGVLCSGALSDSVSIRDKDVCVRPVLWLSLFATDHPQIAPAITFEMTPEVEAEIALEVKPTPVPETTSEAAAESEPETADEPEATVEPEGTPESEPESTPAIDSHEAAEQALNAWLEAKTKTEKDAWVKAILDPQNVRNCRVDVDEDRVRVTFRLSHYTPEEGYAAYTTLADSEYSYSSLVVSAVEAQGEYTLEFTVDDAQLTATKDSGNAVLTGVRKAAAAAKKAFGAKTVCTILADEMLGMRGTPEEPYTNNVDMNRDLGYLDYLPFLNVQLNQSLNVNGGPNALVMTCKTVDLTALVNGAYDRALSKLTVTEYANEFNNYSIHEFLTAALWEESEAMKSKGRKVDVKLTFDLNVLCNTYGSEFPFPFGASYNEYIGGYLDAVEAALEKLYTETRALPDFRLPVFDESTAPEIIGEWMAGKVKNESDVWVKALLNAGPAEIGDIEQREDGSYRVEFYMPKFMPDTDMLDYIAEDPEYDPSMEALSSLLYSIYAADTENPCTLTFTMGNDFLFHADNTEGNALLKQLRSRAGAIKSAFNHKSLGTVLAGNLFKYVWSRYDGDDAVHVRYPDQQLLLRANTSFSLNVSGGPNALKLQCKGPAPEAFANEYYNYLKSVFSRIPYANRYDEDDIRNAIYEMEEQLYKDLAKPKCAASRTWTIDLKELYDCVNADAMSTTPAFLQDYLDTFVAVMDPLFAQLFDDVAAMPDMPYVPMPSTGRISGSGGSGKVIFKTEDSSSNVYIVVKSYYTDETAAVLFIRGAGSATCYLTSGEYYAVIAEGQNWYGEYYLFGDEGVYSRTESFEAPDSRHYLTLTLTGVTDGNMSSWGAGPEDFR